MNEATPGPWGMTQSENGEFFLDEWYVSADGVDGMVAIVNGEANAHRTAAVPIMLGALRDALVDPSKPLREWQVRVITQAIAKAKGEVA